MAAPCVPWLDISYHQLGAQVSLSNAASVNMARMEAQARKVDYGAPGRRGVKAVQVRIGNANRTPSAPSWDEQRMADYSGQLFAEGYRAAGLTNLFAYWWPNPTASLPVQAAVMGESYRRCGLTGPIALDLEDENRATPERWAQVIDYLAKAAADLTGKPALIYTADWWWNSTLAGYNGRWSTLDNLEAEYPGQGLPPWPEAKRPPSDASQWEAWIMARRPGGPSTSKGWVGWDSWQFTSALRAGDFGFPTGNGSGLDGNIAQAAAFGRWFAPPAPEPVPVPLEDAMLVSLDPANGATAKFDAGGGTITWLDGNELADLAPVYGPMKKVTASFIKRFALVGPVPTGDTTRAWSLADFAGQAAAKGDTGPAGKDGKDGKDGIDGGVGPAGPPGPPGPAVDSEFVVRVVSAPV